MDVDHLNVRVRAEPGTRQPAPNYRSQGYQLIEKKCKIIARPFLASCEMAAVYRDWA
jgi:hypothetical protein